MTAMTIARPTIVRTSEPPAEPAPGVFVSGTSSRFSGVFSPVAAANASRASSSSRHAAARAVRKGLGMKDGVPLREFRNRVFIGLSSRQL
jgi:hypothetical protein